MKELELSTLLTELSQAPGASGFEEEALEVAAGYLRPYVDRIERDPFGNLVAFKKGEAPEEGRKSLALVAHIDEIVTRDSRMKERKKYGLKKARRAPQFSKR